MYQSGSIGRQKKYWRQIQAQTVLSWFLIYELNKAIISKLKEILELKNNSAKSDRYIKTLTPYWVFFFKLEYDKQTPQT